MDADDRQALRTAIRRAVRKLKIKDTDSRKDVIGKIYNHMRQESNFGGLSYRFPRIKRLKTSSDLFHQYVVELITIAMDDLYGKEESLEDVLGYMRVLVDEVKSVAEQSGRVSTNLETIERSL